MELRTWRAFSTRETAAAVDSRAKVVVEVSENDGKWKDVCGVIKS